MGRFPPEDRKKSFRLPGRKQGVSSSWALALEEIGEWTFLQGNELLGVPKAVGGI